MNIRRRIVGGLFLAVTLLVLALLHVVWALGLSFPARTLEELGNAVLPLPARTLEVMNDAALPLGGWPSPLITVAVAVCLLIAAALVVFRVIDLNRSRARRSLLLRLAAYGLAVTFGLRALAGFALSLSAWGQNFFIADFVQWNLWLYSPLCVLLSGAAFVLAGQSRIPEDLFAHALAIIRGVSFVQLVTLDAHGAPRSRVLLRLRVERSGVVWMATDIDSQKVADIRRDPRVSLSAYNNAALAAATLEGVAEVVDDASLLKQHWLAALKLYFTKGQKDERYVLLKIVPATYGLVDFSTDVTPEPFGMRRVSLAVPAAPTRQ